MGISQNIQKSHDLDYRVNNEEKNLTTVFNIYIIYIYIYIYILLIINKFRNAYVFNTKVPSKVHHINYFIFFSDSRNGSVIKYLRNKIIYYVRTTSFVFKLYII